MNLVKSFKNLLSGLYLSLKRFPLTIVLSAAVATVLITISEINPAQDTLGKIALILALGIPLSLSIKLIFERINEKSYLRLAMAYIVGGLFLIPYYFLFLKEMNMVSITRYTAVSLALYLAFLFIPFLIKKEHFEMYVITVFSRFLITIIYSAILFCGLSAILFTIDKLLQIHVPEKTYFYTWLIVVFIFALSYFLAGIPLKNQELTEKPYPKAFRILLLYIVTPLLSAYTIILYIYFGKIIVTQQWPVGIVSHLVLWYSVIVTIMLFFITPIKDEISLAHKFLKLAPKIILPLIIMMFVSIGIRINAYGVTERRYFVVILALWVFLIMLYFSFTRRLRNIIIPVTLSIIALISVFGPLSSYSVSMRSQNNMLEKILIRNNMLKDGKLKSNADISKEDKAQISSILDYFNRNHSLKDVNYLPENFKIVDMKDVLGFPFEYSITSPGGEYFYFNRSQSEKSIDIKGYDYLFDMRTLNNSDNGGKNALKVSYDYASSGIKIMYEGKEVYTKDLSSFTENLINKYGSQPNNNALPAEAMTLIEENEKIKVKIVFLNISGNRYDSNENLGDKGLEFYLLVKVK